MLSYESRPAMASPIPPSPDRLPRSPPPSSTLADSSNSVPKRSAQPKTNHTHIWLITGPAGCGKSTVAQYVANAMNLPFLEGDEFHPPANVEKMSKGIPLTDSDRWDWLTKLREESVARLRDGSQGVVLTCSALKRKYRDVIRVAPYYSHSVLVHFVYLHATEKVLLDRVAARKGHYMGANMVHSQFEILEMPGAEETDVIKVDVSGSLEQVEHEALGKIQDAIQRELERDS